MKNWHTEKLVVNDVNVNFNMVVPVDELLKLFEMATFQHSQLMGVDHKTMEEKSNAFWIVSKMKVVNLSPITSGEKINVTTWTRELSTIRALRDCVIKSGQKTKAKFLSEWCCLDLQTRKVRRLNSICYPDLEMERTKYNNITFSNIREQVNETDYVYKRVVRSTDIDMNNHTNNLKYNQMALDAFTVNELNSMIIKEYEVYFVNESHFGDEIRIYKKKIKDGYYIEGVNEEKTIFRAVIKAKRK